MPLDRMVLFLLRGLRTIVLVWVGLLTFALVLEVTGLREAPGPSDFSEMRQRLETRVSVPGNQPEPSYDLRFDNFLVSVYLVPVFLFRWMCGFGASLRISPAAILTGLLSLALISAFAAYLLTLTGPGQAVVERMSVATLYASVFALLLVAPALAAAAIAAAKGAPRAVIGWLILVPGMLDRGLRHILDPHRGRLANRMGHRISYVSNALLLTGLAVPSAAAIWWGCGWLDGRGDSDFAFVMRGVIVSICMAMVVRAHIRAYRLSGPVTTR